MGGGLHRGICKTSHVVISLYMTGSNDIDLQSEPLVAKADSVSGADFLVMRRICCARPLVRISDFSSVFLQQNF